MQRLLLILCFVTNVVYGQQDSLRELLPLLPKEAKLVYTEWKFNPQQVWVRGSAKGNLPIQSSCNNLEPVDWNVLITYDLYNLFNESGRANFSSERTYIEDVYSNIRSEMELSIETEKRNKRNSGFSSLLEEKLGEGKAFYYEYFTDCSAGQGKAARVFYTAYVPFQPGFMQIDIRYLGDLKKVTSYAKEIVFNMKSFENYNLFNNR